MPDKLYISWLDSPLNDKGNNPWYCAVVRLLICNCVNIFFCENENPDSSVVVNARIWLVNRDCIIIVERLFICG